MVMERVTSCYLSLLLSICVTTVVVTQSVAPYDADSSCLDQIGRVPRLPLILNRYDEVDENTFKEKKKEHGNDEVFIEDKSTLQTELKEKEKTHSMPVTKCRDQGYGTLIQKVVRLKAVTTVFLGYS